MIKKILFITAIFICSYSFAQSFQIMDHYDVSIEGINHTEYGDAQTLSETKFHVKNISGAQAFYTAKVQLISNPTNVGLQVCYGVNCYVAGGTNSAIQIIGGGNSVAPGAIDSTFKVAPFSSSWNPGDSCTWRVTVYKNTDATDSSSTIITFIYGTNSIEEITSNDVSFSTYPNPATENLTIDYSIESHFNKARLDVYDMLGQKVDSYKINDTKGKLELDLSHLHSGVYFYTINVNEKILQTKRVIIK